MKILALSADEGGCEFYRIKEPARVARQLGVDIEVSHSIDVRAETTPDGLTTVHEIHSDADIIIMQRPLDNSFTSLIKQAKRQGITTVVELDDDYETISTANVAYGQVNGKTAMGPYWLRQATESADHVTVSTPALEKYAPHGRVSLLRNCVPERFFEMPPAYELHDGIPPVLGWSGTVGTHPYDLQEAGRTVGEILRKNDLNFYVVGDGGRVEQNLDIRNGKMQASGWVDVNEYHKYLLGMTLGIVPLEITPFNQAKSSLKGMEMAAMGIPFVASPTREYLRLEAYGVGKTARNPSEWRRHLQRWIDRPEELRRDAERYRSEVQLSMTYEKNAADWVAAWNKALSYRKSQS
jgi:glycosyltransferase involved in cell wall biosynthesis